MELKRLILTLSICGFSLLIVPYGIETDLSLETYQMVTTFNRTLWN